MAFTTIQVDKSLLARLKKRKTHSRQSYNEVLRGILGHSSSPQYDEYLHHIQKAKMKELWDNPDDEAWEHA
ncbi:MAG: hypothetical protein V1822_02310 [Candidatus Micrarchaeota archaeon]